MESQQKRRSRGRRDRSIQDRVIGRVSGQVLGQIPGQILGRVERVVTVLVEAGLEDHAAPPDLIARLTRLELGLLASGEDRQALQVLASGRRLLGDAAELAPMGLPDIVPAEGPALRGEIVVPVLRHDLPDE